MSVFQPLDPEVAWKLIEGHEDVLAPEAKALDAFYRQFSCPRCREPLVKQFDSRHVFSDQDTMGPRALLCCQGCGYLIDPHTRIVLNTGNPAKVPVETSPLILRDQ